MTLHARWAIYGCMLPALRAGTMPGDAVAAGYLKAALLLVLTTVFSNAAVYARRHVVRIHALLSQ